MLPSKCASAGQNALITKTASIYSAAIPTAFNPSLPQVALAGAQSVRAYSTFISNFNQVYGGASALTFPVPTNWPNSGLLIQKRDAACTPAHSTTAPPTLIASSFGSSAILTITAAAVLPSVTAPPAAQPPIISVIEICDDGAGDIGPCGQIGGKSIGSRTITITPQPTQTPIIEVIPICDDGVDAPAACGQIGGIPIGSATLTITPTLTPPEPSQQPPSVPAQPVSIKLAKIGLATWSLVRRLAVK